MIIQSSPNAKYETAKDGVCPIISTTVNTLAVAANTLLVSPTTGKRIRVVGGVTSSTGALTVLNFLSGSGGTSLRILTVPLNTVANPNMLLVPSEDDQFETATSTGLYVTNTATTCYLSINYIVYTP